MFAPAHATEREARFASVIEEIHIYGLAHQGVTRKHLIEKFSIRHFAEFKQKHYRQMLEQLVKDERAEFGKGDKDLVPITFR